MIWQYTSLEKYQDGWYQEDEKGKEQFVDTGLLGALNQLGHFLWEAFSVLACDNTGPYKVYLKRKIDG